MATARGTLTLVTDTTPIPAASAPTPNRAHAFTPITDPVREAALEAALEPDVIDAMDVAIGRALDHMHNNRGIPLGGILAEVWRAALVAGYRAACDDRTEAGIAEGLAEVIALHNRRGGDSA